MNRMWLREYEILLSSNRRDRKPKGQISCKVYDRPHSAAATLGSRGTAVNGGGGGGNDQEGTNPTITHSGKKSTIKKKKKKDLNTIQNEDELAIEILAISAKGEYHLSAPELNEKKFGTKKYSQQRPKNKSPFRPLNTFDAFEQKEKKRDLFYQTGDERIFHEIYPPINSKFDPLIPASGKEEEHPQLVRRKSSPSKRAHASSVVSALLKSTEEFQITSKDLQIEVAPIDKSIAKQAEGMWQDLVTEIWTCGQCILYGDLTAFASNWQKTPTSRYVVRYLCALFGLKTHTSHLLVLGAERSLFRELLPLLTYLREVNPLTVPRKRLLKARTIYEKYFIPMKEEHSLQITDSESRLHISPLEQKFLSWVQAFHQVLSIVLHASVHQVLLENDAIDYAEETLQSLQRKDQLQQFTSQPTDASISAQRYIAIKKKRIPSQAIASSFPTQQQQQIAETSISSSTTTPSLAMISLTGVLPMDEILPPEEKKKSLRMKRIEEEQGVSSSPLQTALSSARDQIITDTNKGYLANPYPDNDERERPGDGQRQGEEGEGEEGVGNDLLGGSLSSISHGGGSLLEIVVTT